MNAPKLMVTQESIPKHIQYGNGWPKSRYAEALKVLVDTDT
ncbi:MAG: hypothetical protein ACRC62_07695 [Microcoleus sp.]